MKVHKKRTVVADFLPVLRAQDAGGIRIHGLAQGRGDEDKINAGILVGFLPVVGPTVSERVSEIQNVESAGRLAVALEGFEGGFVAAFVEVSPENEREGGIRGKGVVEFAANGTGLAQAEGGGIATGNLAFGFEVQTDECPEMFRSDLDGGPEKSAARGFVFSVEGEAQMGFGLVLKG